MPSQPLIRRITAFMFCCLSLRNPASDDLRHVWYPESPIISAEFATYGLLAGGGLMLCAAVALVALGMAGAL